MTESSAAIPAGAALPRPALAFWPQGRARLCQLAAVPRSVACGGWTGQARSRTAAVLSRTASWLRDACRVRIPGCSRCCPSPLREKQSFACESRCPARWGASSSNSVALQRCCLLVCPGKRESKAASPKKDKCIGTSSPVFAPASFPARGESPCLEVVSLLKLKW